MKIPFTLLAGLCILSSPTFAHTPEHFTCPKPDSLDWESHPPGSRWEYKGTKKYWLGTLWVNTKENLKRTGAEAFKKDDIKSQDPYYQIKCSYQTDDGSTQYLVQDIGHRSYCKSRKTTVYCNP